MAEKVQDIMTPDPICCLTTDSVLHAAQVMRDEDIGSVPVIGDSQQKGLLGIVTDRDLTINVLAEARDPKSTRVGNVMTDQPVSCHPDDDATAVMDLMAQHQIRRIPVVDANNRIVGIVAQADVAMRLEEPSKTGKVVERISEPNNGSSEH